MSFVGSYTHSLDAKKRVFIPSKFREELGNEFYITRKYEPYLSVYTAEDWEKYVDIISSLPESEASMLQEHILWFAQKCTPDSSGRIVIDERLVEYAKINKNIVFAGTGKQIKIWAEEIWIERESKRDLNEIRELMRKYGL